MSGAVGSNGSAGGAAPALEVAGLGHSFGRVPVLADVSFRIPAGAFAVLLGLNGAGKTTLFSLVTRLYNSRAGSIRVLGLDLRRQPLKALARMGVVFQQPTLDLDLTVDQNLRYHAALHGLSGREAGERGRDELARAGLLERLGARVRELSGGQRRRVEIARALLHRPRLLLLDEPTVGLDVASRQAILDHVRLLVREQGLAVLWATHLMDEIAPADQVIVLHKGRVLAADRAESIWRAVDAPEMGGAFGALIRGAEAA